MRSWWCVKDKMQIRALVLITITVMLQVHIKGCVETERIGLLELKSYIKSFRSPNEGSILLESWSDDDFTSDCCLWEMVKCNDAIGGHIVDLSLDAIMYNGDMSLNLSLLHSFPLLESLNFSINILKNLFDPIHGYKSFHKLEKLRTLDLSHNNLNNSVFPFLNEARSLRTLYLGNNYLEGVFPPKELANMTELKVLDLHSNRFDLFSAKGLINFRELEELNLNHNELHIVQAGSDHRSFRRLEKLRTLDLSFNGFNNNVFPFLSIATRVLMSLNLDGNEMEGVFPPNGLEHLVELKFLHLRDNKFNGSGPTQVFKVMPKLQELDLYGNEFTDLDLMFPSSLQVLNLGRNYQLSSSTPRGYSEICKLANIRELDLSSNALTRMPNCLGNLTRLRTLQLSHNQLDGDLSSFVYSLPSTLEYLALLQNNFNESFSFNSLANHTRLEVFKMSSYDGMIQPQAGSSWVPMFQLKILKLHDFILGNTIPSFLVHQRDLHLVDLSNNNLTGAFPTWLVQNNTRLQRLSMSRNSLTKFRLPRLAHDLEFLEISSNRISDSLQKDIGIVFPNLRTIKFASNHFKGAIPSSMGEMKSLVTLDMSYNDLSGKLPTPFLNGCYSLLFLNLSNNRFQGEVFPEHTNLTSLGTLALDGNNFNGSLGKGLSNSKYLYTLDISNNGISGPLPVWIGRMSSLLILNMRGNQLKGPFPHQLLHSLQRLDISHNQFSGSISKEFNFRHLEELRLQSNEFMGTIPDTFFKTEQLKVLDLRNNNFSGKIPNTIGDRSSLRVLLLGNNGLQSGIPENICKLSNINLLDLSHNSFTGVIPSCFDNMSFGEEEDSEYGGGGYVSTQYLQSWKYVSALNLELGLDLEDDLEDLGHSYPVTGVEFIMKSRYERYQGDISYSLFGLDLSNNQLSGEIPVEIGNLTNILSLNLSSNRLIGSIPDSFSKLKSLESLDLSNNKLDGRIPYQLGGLDNMEVFYVSYNNLSGEIPINGHLLTFNEIRSYIGNAYLCGPPTTKNCSSTKDSKQAEEEDNDGVIDMVWFYWTCGAVYISTALASFVFLCIDTRWSRKWFYRVDVMVHHLHRFKGHFVRN